MRLDRPLFLLSIVTRKALIDLLAYDAAHLSLNGSEEASEYWATLNQAVGALIPQLLTRYRSPE